jgi:serine protease
MATPHVAGAAALLLAQQATLTPDEIKFLLTSSARPFPQGLACSLLGLCGAGLLDASAALAKLADRTPALTISAPTLVAGGQTATLTATATARNGGSGTFAYSWQQTAGPAVTLNSTSGAMVSFTAPNPGGTHTFRVGVTDGNGYTSTQTATVRTNNAPAAPVASPGGPYAVVAGGTLSFSVAATDPEADVLTYVATNVPTGASFTAASGAFSWSNAGPAGTYNMEVRANDGNVNSAPLAVTITVSAAPPPPPPPSSGGGGGGGGSLPMGWIVLMLAALPVSRTVRRIS